MSRCILVTGGAGYVGSHACKALAKAGYTPVTYDNLSGGHRWAVKWGPFEAGDLLDRDRLDEVIRRYRPTAVMHFAACGQDQRRHDPKHGGKPARIQGRSMPGRWGNQRILATWREMDGLHGGDRQEWLRPVVFWPSIRQDRAW